MPTVSPSQMSVPFGDECFQQCHYLFLFTQLSHGGADRRDFYRLSKKPRCPGASHHWRNSFSGLLS
jgi:hypothetical protein